MIMRTMSATTTSTNRNNETDSEAASNPTGGKPCDESRKKDGDIDTTAERDIFNPDTFRELERFLVSDTTRLILKWEKGSVDNSNRNSSCSNDNGIGIGIGKIILGTNTHLPLGGRGCFSLDVPQRRPLQSLLPAPSSSSSSSLLPKKRQEHAASARELLFRLVSKITILSPRIRQLDLEGFGGNRRHETDKNTHTALDIDSDIDLDIEDVFEAFARNESSSWRNGFLAVVRTWDCDMDSHRGNDGFGMAEHEYPEGLEEVYVHNPRGSVLSSSIFKIARKAPKLHRFYVFHGYNDANGGEEQQRRRSNNGFGNPHRFQGSRLTRSSIDAICEIFSSTNQLLEMNQLPFRELLQLPDADFCQVLTATTSSPNSIPVLLSRREPPALRFPISTSKAKQTRSTLAVLATRSEALRFYFLWKRSLEVLRNPQKRSLSPRVLELCQRRKSTKQWIPCNQIDLLFAMLQDSLEGILEVQASSATATTVRQLPIPIPLRQPR